MKILIPVDGSVYSDNAVAFVASRTTLIGHEPHIVLLNVQAPLPARASRLVSREALEDYYKDESEKAFKPARKILKKAKMAAEEIAKVGAPAEEIAKVAEDMKADLLIMGSHGRSALKGLLFGSVTNAVLALTKVPLLMLRDKEAPTTDALSVGIAVDGSGFGDLCTKFAVQNKDLFGTDASFEVIYVHADEETVPSELLDKGVLELDKLLPKYEHKEYTNAVESPLAQLKAAGLKAKPVELRGSLQTTLTHYADENLNIVVMGSHGKGRISSLVFGSSTRAMVASCRMPIFIVPGEA